MRMINAEELIEHLENVYKRAGWDEAEVHFSLRDMKANIDGEMEIPVVVTVYGNHIEDLALLGLILRKAGKTPEDVEIMARDAKSMMDFIVAAITNEMEERWREGDG